MILAARFLVLLVFLSLGHVAADSVTIETTSDERLSGDLSVVDGKFVLGATNDTPREISFAQLKRLRHVPAQVPTNNLTILASPPSNGLLGIYFNTPDCTGDFFKTRYDPVIDFDWGQSAPLPGMNSNNFSVRWLGKLVVSNSEHYTFHTVTDDGVRLWLNNKLIVDAWKDEFLNLAASPVVLIGGQTNDIRMEMYDAGNRAVARLFWSSPTTPRGLVPADRLVPASNVDLPTVPATEFAYRPGVLLVTGTLIPGAVDSADRSSIRVTGLREPVSRVQVARLIFQSMREQSDTVLQRGRAGVLLKNGDFVEGDFDQIRSGQIEISSVILGTRRIPVAQAVAVSLREPKPVRSVFEIRTRSGGVYRTSAPRLQEDAVVITDAGLPRLTVPAADLLEIKRL